MNSFNPLKLSRRALYLSCGTNALALIAQAILACYMQVVQTAEKQRYSHFLISLSQKYLFCQPLHRETFSYVLLSFLMSAFLSVPLVCQQAGQEREKV